MKPLDQTRPIMPRLLLALLGLIGFHLPSIMAAPLVYRGDTGPGVGKHIVFLAGDHEYRSEETLPALARILAKRHGFTCTVLFTVDRDSGVIVPGNSNMPGMEALATADLAVVFLRFQSFPPEQMKHFVAYLERGGPIVGLRTATHAFNEIPADSPYAKFNTRYQGADYPFGFGHQVLGQTWVGHYGTNHQQSTRLTTLPAGEAHPIFRGVKDAWIQCGAYVGKPVDSEVLSMAQPLNGMTPDSPADPAKPAMPAAWTRSYRFSPDREPARVFTSLYGASEDILNEGYRRTLINACFWAMGLERAITLDGDIRFVGPYHPSTFRFDGHRQGIRPDELAGWTSPIMPTDKPR